MPAQMDGEEARDAGPAFDVFAPDWPSDAQLAGEPQAAASMQGFEEAERELFGHSQTPLDPGPPAGSLNRSQSAVQLPSPPPSDPWDHFQGDRLTSFIACLGHALTHSPGIIPNAIVHTCAVLKSCKPAPRETRGRQLFAWSVIAGNCFCNCHHAYASALRSRQSCSEEMLDCSCLTVLHFCTNADAFATTKMQPQTMLYPPFMKVFSMVHMQSEKLQADFACADNHRPGNLGRSVSLSQLPRPPVQFSFNGQPGLRADRETAIRGEPFASSLQCPH